MRDGLPRLGVPMQTPVLIGVSAPLNFCATIIETWYARTAVIAREDLRTGGSMGGWTHREEGSGSSAVSRGNEVTASHGVTGGNGIGYQKRTQSLAMLDASCCFHTNGPHGMSAAGHWLSSSEYQPMNGSLPSSNSPHNRMTVPSFGAVSIGIHPFSSGLVMASPSKNICGSTNHRGSLSYQNGRHWTPCTACTQLHSRRNYLRRSIRVP